MTRNGYPEHLRSLVEGYLAELRFSSRRPADQLAEAMRYSLLAGGKRIRPVLTLAVAEGLARPTEPLLPTAAALELIHTYSLIHDDLPAIDNDTLRRGKPTCHVVYGEDVAILAGDGLFAEAFGLVLERQQAEPALLVAVLREISRATGVRGMVGGQYIDVTQNGADAVDLRQLHEMKTGRLIEAAVVCGALLCEVGADEIQLYRAVAAEMGLLFQIVDDILDEVGEDAKLGKTAGKDARAGKATYTTRFGLRRARELAAESHARAAERLAVLPGQPRALRAIAEYIYRRDQ
ncbi:MAG: polyprenyl synthetase family protein [Actinobacteria bacterium]|nr:polyprenyl synthetase family protein [Actinomycetota bacterium]